MIGRSEDSSFQRRPGVPLVLHIDDEEDVCRMLALTLESRAMQVVSSQDGLHGLQLVRNLRPDLVVLDIKMPRVNGFQVLAQMQQDPSLARIPVMVLSCIDEHRERPEEEWARRLNIQRFVNKPADPEEIIAAVENCIRGRGGETSMVEADAAEGQPPRG